MNKLIQNNLEIEIIDVTSIIYDLDKNDWKEIQFSVNSRDELSDFSFTNNFRIKRNGITSEITPSSFKITDNICTIKPERCRLIG